MLKVFFKCRVGKKLGEWSGERLGERSGERCGERSGERCVSGWRSGWVRG